MVAKEANEARQKCTNVLAKRLDYPRQTVLIVYLVDDILLQCAVQKK